MPLTARLLVVASLATSAAVVSAAPATAATTPAPVITGVVPVQGSTVGYTEVIINGRGFTGVSSVVIGGVKATRVHMLSAGRLTVAAPPHGHGVKNVVVHTSHGTSRLSKTTTFNYVHATLPGTWTSSRVAPPPDAGTYDDMRLTDTSCPTVSTCYSIGGVADDYEGNDPPPSTGDGPVIRTRTGSSASIMNAPLPADADQSALYAATVETIDCPAVDSCAAVGLYPVSAPNSTRGYTSHVMLLELSGGVWRAQAAPTGTAVTSTDDVGFNATPDVSCGAPGVCLAGVVLYGAETRTHQAGVLYRLAGTTWTGARPVVPSGATATGVDHVSCPTATYCAAALVSSPNTYLNVLDNNRLTAEAVHAPAGIAQADYRPDVLGLQCTDAQKCVAVIGRVHGKYYNTNFLRLAGSGLDGQAQHLIPPPDDIYSKGKTVGYHANNNLRLGQTLGLTLDCPSTTTCFTIDHYYAAAGTIVEEHSIVARLAGSTVHVFVMPEVAGTGTARTFLDNLSCPSVSSCIAVGSREPYGDSDNYMDDKNFPSAPYDIFANGVWTPGSLPTVANQPYPSQGQFVDLDCPAIGHCFADAAYVYDPSTDSDRQEYNRSQDLDAVLTPN